MIKKKKKNHKKKSLNIETDRQKKLSKHSQKKDSKDECVKTDE